jgi:hypothetical protein
MARTHFGTVTPACGAASNLLTPDIAEVDCKSCARIPGEGYYAAIRGLESNKEGSRLMKCFSRVVLRRTAREVNDCEVTMAPQQLATKIRKLRDRAPITT